MNNCNINIMNNSLPNINNSNEEIRNPTSSRIDNSKVISNKNINSNNINILPINTKTPTINSYDQDKQRKSSSNTNSINKSYSLLRSNPIARTLTNNNISKAKQSFSYTKKYKLRKPNSKSSLKTYNSQSIRNNYKNSNIDCSLSDTKRRESIAYTLNIPKDTLIEKFQIKSYLKRKSLYEANLYNDENDIKAKSNRNSCNVIDDRNSKEEEKEQLSIFDEFYIQNSKNKQLSDSSIEEKKAIKDFNDLLEKSK